jgi:hypothetical protein
MEFNILNSMLVDTGFEEFHFDVSSFLIDVQTLGFDQFKSFISELQNYLEGRNKELENPPIASNDMMSYGYKVSHVHKQLKWFVAKVCLIKEDAGQGKTNFICDLVENFILKRNIPAIFLLGTELDPNDIRGSILKKVFPDSTEFSFSQFLSDIQQQCSLTNQPFTLIIDGLNENANPNLLSKNLEDFISEITEHDFIRVIISCRSEYYDKHFSNFNKATFSSFMNEVPTLRIHNDKMSAKKIFWSYMDYFDIEIASYNIGVYEQMTRNFLLLRIFCDSHQHEKIPYLGSIQKQALFERYYQNKVEEITKRMNEDDELRVMGKIDIKRFLENLIQYMIQHKTYENIPFEDLLSKGDNRKVYVRFLDENILVRRDPTASTSVFSVQEVVNFTFDEFRDYLIADYLINKIYPQDAGQFSNFLKKEIDPSSRILEGCGTFLFYIARKSSDDSLKKIVESQSWYPRIFLRCIFNLEDRYISKKDRDTIFGYIRSKGRPAIRMFNHFLNRRKITDTPNLNLDHYLSFLRSLNAMEFEHIFTKMFVDSDYAIYGEIVQERFLARYNSFFGDGSSSLTEKDFEILIYMFNNQSKWNIYSIYEMFYHRFPEIAKVQLQDAFTSNNVDLTNSINQFCRRYDISL